MSGVRTDMLIFYGVVPAFVGTSGRTTELLTTHLPPVLNASCGTVYILLSASVDDRLAHSNSA